MATIADVAAQFSITEDQVRNLQAVMSRTWDEIGGDWMSSFESYSEMQEMFATEASMIAEATLDADRWHHHSEGIDFSFLDVAANGDSRFDALDMGTAAWTAR